MSNTKHTPGQQVTMPTGYTGLRIIGTVALVENGYVHARVDGIERAGVHVSAGGLIQIGSMRTERAEHCYSVAAAKSTT